MIIWRSQDGKPLPLPEVTMEEINDPVEWERARAQIEAHRRNSDWLQTQWPRLLPRALGKCVAVADQEAFIAETSEEAWSWIRANHPNDPGAFIQSVLPSQGPRIYAHRG
jgi:hypothetical protein